MHKIESEFIVDHYNSVVESYADFTRNVGLWESEKYAFQKYLSISDHILDIGCGAGRTTFPLYRAGHQNIIGVDLSPAMIKKAEELNEHYESKVSFQTGDACKLNFKDAGFDAVLFTFNGMMTIPGQVNRDDALKEIWRVLKENGIFIFTAMDRDRDPAYSKFWEFQREMWAAGTQNKKLYDYGDLLQYSKKEDREVYFHVPAGQEITEWLTASGFRIMETFYRDEKFTEKEQVKAKAGDCRFYIAKKALDNDGN